MNCLVVMPDFKYHSLVPYRFPLEPGYLSAVLKQTEGLNTKTLNLNDVEGDCLVGLLRAIRAGNAEIVLLYGSYTDYHCVRDAVAAIKKYDAAIKTVAFGGLITGDPLTVMRGMEQLDYGLIGEVERGGPKLCLALKRGEDPKNISGLVLRNGGGLEITGPPELASDLSSLPWCDYEGFGFGHYLDTRGVEAGNLFQSFPHRTLPIRTSRSCIGACTFCIRHIENRYRERNLDDVFNELDFLADKYDIQYILFMDEMLGRTPQRLEEICRRLKKYNLSGWHAEFRFDLMRPEAYEMIRHAGCKTMAPGIESASNAVLKSMGKNMSFAQIADGLERAHAAGLKNQGVFIFGDPAETYETAMETIDWWKAHPQYNIYATPVFCFPGSAVYKKAVAEGLIEDPLEYIENGCPPINLSKIPADRYEEIMRLLAEHNRDIIEAWPVFAYTSIDADPGRRMTHSFRAVCGCCGRESVFERTRLYDTQWLACRHCETRHQLPPLLDVAPNIQKNLAALLAEYGQVAFWGIGRGFKTLIKPEYLDLPGLHLLDTQPGGTFGPLRVEAPETIIKHSIKFAVIPPPSSPWYEDIIRELKKYGVTSYTDLHNLQWSHLPIY